MPRELERWERCDRNRFSGMHIWQLDGARDETNRPIKGGGRTAGTDEALLEPQLIRDQIETEQPAADDATGAPAAGEQPPPTDTISQPLVQG